MSVLIVAAGRGRRLGTRGPKQFLRLGRQTVLERCVQAFEATPSVRDIWLVLPRGHGRTAQRLSRRFRKVRGAVTGGRERGDSVARGLKRVTHDGLVLVHDAARPLVSRDIIDRVIGAARRHGAALPATPVSDALKRAGRGGHVERSLSRERVWAVQTPQGFRVSLLRRAYSGRGLVRAPDDGALVERLGARVQLVRGSVLNFKVTWKEDLLLARAVVACGRRG